MECKVAWAYIGYEATDNLKFLFGRQRLPLYTYSDYLDVSYAYHWITPPEATYGSVPFDSANGIGAIYNLAMGPVDSRLHFLYGRNQEKIYFEGEERTADIKNMASLSWIIDYEWLNFRAGYSQADIKLNIPEIHQLTDGWTALGGGIEGATGSNPGWSEFSSYILPDDDNNTGSFLDFAITLNPDSFLFVAEYTKLSTKGSLVGAEDEGYFASVGKQFDDFMPHITYGVAETTPTDTNFLNGVRALLGSGVIPAVPIDADGTLLPDAIGGTVIQTEMLFNSAASKQKYWTLGVKWNFHPAASFKAEYSRRTNELNDDTDSIFRFALVTVF